MNNKRLRRFSIGAAILIAAAVVFLLAFELYLRLTRTQVVERDSRSLPILALNDAEILVEYTQRGRRLIPGARVLIKNHRISGRDIVMEINSRGFRDEEIGASKGQDELRILVLGDSITWGSYLAAEEVYVERIEEELRRALKDRRVEVINAGVGDIGLKEEISILEERGLALEPDLVIVSFYLNDSRPPWGFPGEIGSRGWLRRHCLLAETIYKNLKLRRWIRERGEGRLEWTSAMNDPSWVSDRGAFLKLAAKAKYDWGAAWEEESWGKIEREFNRLKEISEHRDFAVMILFFPNAFQVYTGFLEDTPQRMLREIADRFGFFYLDLLPMLRGYRRKEKDIYFDWCHPTVKTNSFIGKKVADFLIENDIAF